MKTTILTFLGLISFLQLWSQYGVSAGSMSYARQIGNTSTSGSSGRDCYSFNKNFSMPDEQIFIVEDFMNYHKHKITIPRESDVALSIDYDNSILKSKNEFILQVGIATQPAELRRGKQNKVNISLVVDVSGSMEGQKIELVKKSMNKFIRSLKDGDYLSIILFDTEASVLLTCTSLEANRQNIYAMVDKIYTRESTNLNAGMLLGYKEILKQHRSDTNSRVILLTDGQTNHGEVNHEQIIRNSLDYNEKGISISTIGVGESLDFDLLRQLADRGRGTNYFIGENEGDINKVFDEELNALLYKVGDRPLLTIDLPDGWQIEECFGYNPTYRGNSKVTIDLGSLNASSTRIVMMKIRKNGDRECDNQISANLNFIKNSETLSINSKKKYSSEISSTNDEIGMNYDIAFMAQTLKRAAHKYACNDVSGAKEILNSTSLAMKCSPYSGNQNFNRVYGILKSYCSDSDSDSRFTRIPVF